MHRCCKNGEISIVAFLRRFAQNAEQKRDCLANIITRAGKHVASLLGLFIDSTKETPLSCLFS